MCLYSDTILGSEINNQEICIGPWINFPKKNVKNLKNAVKYVDLSLTPKYYNMYNEVLHFVLIFIITLLIYFKFP